MLIERQYACERTAKGGFDIHSSVPVVACPTTPFRLSQNLSLLTVSMRRELGLFVGSVSADELADIGPEESATGEGDGGGGGGGGGGASVGRDKAIVKSTEKLRRAARASSKTMPEVCRALYALKIKNNIQQYHAFVKKNPRPVDDDYEEQPWPPITAAMTTSPNYMYGSSPSAVAIAKIAAADYAVIRPYLWRVIAMLETGAIISVDATFRLAMHMTDNAATCYVFILNMEGKVVWFAPLDSESAAWLEPAYRGLQARNDRISPGKRQPLAKYSDTCCNRTFNIGASCLAEQCFTWITRTDLLDAFHAFRRASIKTNGARFSKDDARELGRDLSMALFKVEPASLAKTVKHAKTMRKYNAFKGCDANSTLHAIVSQFFCYLLLSMPSLCLYSPPSARGYCALGSLPALQPPTLHRPGLHGHRRRGRGSARQVAQERRRSRLARQVPQAWLRGGVQ